MVGSSISLADGTSNNMATRTDTTSSTYTLKGSLLVAAQFSLVLYLIVTGPVLAQAPAPLLFLLAGMALGVWAVIAMAPHGIRAAPEPKAAQLTQTGPYRWIRHPMYTALLLMCVGWLLGDLTATRAVVFTLLCTVLLLKLRYEERLLCAHFAGYEEYRKTTAALIPCIF